MNKYESVLTPKPDPEAVDLATIYVIGIETGFLNALIDAANERNKCGCHQCQLKIDEKINVAWAENKRLDPCGKIDEEEDLIRFLAATGQFSEPEKPVIIRKPKRRHKRRGKHYNCDDFDPDQ